MRFRLNAFAASLTLVFAVGLTPYADAAGKGPLRPFDVQNFCASVANPMAEINPKHLNDRYRFQTMLNEASGAMSSDMQELVNLKIRTFLNNRMPSLLCSQNDFNPNNGNVLKLAVSRQSNRFIDYVLEQWKPDLNQIDAVDGRTVLDYIEFRKAEAGATSTFARTLDRYYKRFRAVGARHAAELK